MTIADTLKRTSREAVQHLKQMGFEVIMLTEDRRKTAEAIAASDITLMSGDLRGLVTAIQLARATMRNIRQNLFFAFIYNVLSIPIAAGILYPAFHWLLNPMLAGAAMALSSVSVVANALRLKRLRPL